MEDNQGTPKAAHQESTMAGPSDTAANASATTADPSGKFQISPSICYQAQFPASQAMKLEMLLSSYILAATIHTSSSHFLPNSRHSFTPVQQHFCGYFVDGSNIDQVVMTSLSRLSGRPSTGLTSNRPFLVCSTPGLSI